MSGTRWQCEKHKPRWGRALDCPEVPGGMGLVQALLDGLVSFSVQLAVDPRDPHVWSWPSGSLPLPGIDGDWQRRQRGVARGIRCGGNLGARCQDGNEDRLGVGCQQTKHKHKHKPEA